MNPLVASTAPLGTVLDGQSQSGFLNDQYPESGTRGQNFLRNYPGVQDKGFFVDWESDAVTMPVYGDPNWGAKHDSGFTVAGNDTFKKFTPVEMPDYEHVPDHRFGDAVPVPMPDYKQRFNLLDPLSWLKGKIQSTREQVQGGGYAPEGPPVSPVDQTFRGLSGRNRRLQMMMDEAGW